uniref:Ion transport domain-containing protein n=1 Tax=Spongospora subterranea TaxID=70186 RepID=A0A0H5QRG0_9EUKA|eukprot:CRZ04623.1 hypothetical protein [Spongospora subterranea]
MVVRVVSSSIQPFAMVTFMIVIVVVFYASAVYFTDSTTSDQVYIATSSKSRILGFESIPTGLYWAVSTVCTVGYGDVVPYTMPGKLIGGLAAGSGILVLAIPISIVGQKFLEENSRYQASQAAAKSASIVKMVGEAVNQLGTKLERKYGITDGFPGNNQSPQTEPTNFTTFHSQANDEYRELEAIVYRSFSRRESSVKAALADEGQTVFGQFQHILRNLMEGTPI